MLNNAGTILARALQARKAKNRNAKSGSTRTNLEWKKAPGNIHLFEFIDLDIVPFPLRETEREILELFHGPIFSGYTHWVASIILSFALKNGCTRLMELGAGTAPLTRAIAQSNESCDIKLVPCDLYPNPDNLKALAKRYPHIVEPIFTSVDFSKEMRCAPHTLLVISTAFHHIPPESRAKILASLARAADGVFIFEPLRRNLASIAFVLLGPIFALLAPLLLIRRKGTLRRILFIWLLPIAPLMVAFDGLVSALRTNNELEWQNMLSVVGHQTGKSWAIRSKTLWQMIALVDSSLSFEDGTSTQPHV